MEERSLAKSLEVLEALATSPQPLSVAQLGPQFKLTRPTVYRILGTFSRQEYVTRQSDGPLYRPSVKLLEIAQQLLERTDLSASTDALRGAGQSRLGAPAGEPDPEHPVPVRPAHTDAANDRDDCPAGAGVLPYPAARRRCRRGRIRG